MVIYLHTTVVIGLTILEWGRSQVSVHSFEETLNDIYPFHNLDNLDKSSIVQVLVKGGSWKDGAHISGIVKLIPPSQILYHHDQRIK